MNVLDRIYTWLDRLRAPGQHVTFGPTRTPSELLELHLAPSRLEREVHRDSCPNCRTGGAA